MTTRYSRRQLLAGLGAAAGAAIALRAPLDGATAKVFRGIFPILATPYTAAGGVDFEDLAYQVEFFEKCGAHGMAWPQHASGYPGGVNKEERMRGMEVLAKAAKGRKPALLLGVQSTSTERMLEFARRAEELGPDGLIAMPALEARSVEDYRTYYMALGKLTKRPVFIQTSGGAQGIDPPVEFLIDLVKEFPHLGYVKEEVNPVNDRMKALIKAKPGVKAVFSGANGYNMTYEMRFGADGNMAGSAVHGRLCSRLGLVPVRAKGEGAGGVWQPLVDAQPDAPVQRRAAVHHEKARSVQDHGEPEPQRPADGH
jgi:dihydrodipicolinate synthase/N-acetylneuraminate lyase